MPAIDADYKTLKEFEQYKHLSSDEESVEIINLDEIKLKYESKKEPKIYREIMLITISLFMGYASLVCLQKKLYNKWQDNIGATLSSNQKQLFEHGTSLVYFGNLLFRLLHNVIFCPWTPRYRVVISLLAMCVSMAILFVSYWWFESTFVGWVYLSYLFGGIGIGSFESNILATITPLGHETKLWAMMGISVGFVTITVGGYGLMALVDLDVEYIYMAVFVSCFFSIFLFLLRIPIPSSYDHQQSFKQFINHLVYWKEWLPDIKWFCFALMLDMFCLSYNTAINQYIYDGASFPLFGQLYPGKFMIDQNVFLCLLNFVQFLGDISGRKVIYYFDLKVRPHYFLILSFLGIAGCQSKIPILCLCSTILVMFSNGAIYSASTYFMDTRLVNDKRKYLLTALSAWLFIGDLGSLAGSNVWESTVGFVCNLTYSSPQYFCVPK